MKISGLDHLLLRVKSPARSLGFYRDLLRLPCEVEGSDAAPERVTVRLGGAVSLVLSAGEARSDVALSLQVEDPDVFATELTSRGLDLVEAPHDTRDHTRRCTVRDPDGLELYFERPLERPKA